MVRVRAPATSANLGSGFDVFGVALDRPADYVRAEPADEMTIDITGVGGRYIPEDPEKNVIGAVADELGVSAEVHLDNGVRPASGLGSSAASAAGAAVALNQLYDLGYTRLELVPIAAEGEAVVAGEAHADNVAPALLGGFTIVRGEGVTTVDASLSLVACLPEIVVSTSDAREVVPDLVPLTDVVETVGSAATLVTGMHRNDPDLVGRGLQDEIVTPTRSSLIEGYEGAKEAALAAGATGVTVSGAGPAVLAICREEERLAVASTMIEAFDAVDVDARGFKTQIGDGATVLEG
ncbi:MAG: homoserine kinase [Halobacteriales archaeon]|jgi:homoserine kinase